MISRRIFSLTAIAAGLGCVHQSAEAATEAPDLAAAKAKYRTVIHFPSPSPTPVAKPPINLFSIVNYPSAVGDLAAYLTPDPGDGKKHPAIVWLTGGETNTIGDVWTPEDRDNDQSAAAYRQAGIVMMFPSLRGGNLNPGKQEGLYGEVDDVLAAADYLAALPYVDPARIYLGGHSTGGSLACLTAETRGDRFRAVFASGPVHDVSIYGDWFIPYDFTALPSLERTLRAPVEWLSSVKGRLFIVEGDGGNIGALRLMKARNTNANITFVEVPNATHFSVLAPLNDVLAAKIIADTSGALPFTLSSEEVIAAMS